MHRLKKFFKTLLLPLVFILGPWFLLVAGDSLPLSLHNLSIINLVFFSLGLLLALFFDKSRYFLALLFSLALFLIFFFDSFPSGFADNPLLFILLFVFWANIFYLSLSREKGIFSPPGRKKLFFILIQLIALPLLIFPNQEILSEIFPIVLDFFDLDSSQPLIIFFLGSGVLFLCFLAFLREDSIPITLGTVFSLSFFPFLFPNNDQAWPVFYFGLVIFLIIQTLLDLYVLAYLDELTGLPSRRSLKQDSLKISKPFSIAMVDIDHFKRVNDRYGHDTGDQVLKYLAVLMQKTSGVGKPYRYGGEEFAVIFPGLSKEEAISNLEALKEKMAQKPFFIRGKRRTGKKTGEKGSQKSPGRLKITASMGLADNRGRTNPQEVLKAADKALYKAKKGGRNKIVLSP